ncbi:MAG TPA: carboxypeptidase-like regulatory domain-containing protein [Kofleriaceae bacterium]|nr:carboxypeptidase-like regulatory domain-containing protein [Kofleriaceae bacterium]
MLRPLLALVLAGCAATAAPPPVEDGADLQPTAGPRGSLSGQVRDVGAAGGAAPVSFAAVEATAADGTRYVDSTGADGAFRLQVPPGRYDVAASYAGLRVASRDLVVLEGHATSVHLDLDSRPPRSRAGGSAADVPGATGAIAGRIITSEDGEPFAGAVVAAITPALSDSPMAMSGDSGDYRIAGLPPGSYDVTVYYQLVDRGAIELRRNNIEVTAGRVTRVDLEIDLRVRR